MSVCSPKYYSPLEGRSLYVYESNFQTHLVDNVLSGLSLLAMTDNRWESVIDGILEKLCNNTNTLMEAFPQFLDSNFLPKEIPLHNHRVGHLPKAALTKLTDIELLLKSHYHTPVLWDVIEDLMRRFTKTNDYSILDIALADYREKFQ